MNGESISVPPMGTAHVTGLGVTTWRAEYAAVRLIRFHPDGRREIEVVIGDIKRQMTLDVQACRHLALLLTEWPLAEEPIL